MDAGSKVLVAGATGTAGSAYVRALVAAGYRVRGTVTPGRDAAGLRRAGAEEVEVDLLNPADAERAVRGVEAVVIAIRGRGAEPVQREAAITRNLVAAAVSAGASRVVYTSVYRADEPTGVPHFELKAELERELRTSGLRHTILRPATFMDVFDSPWIRGPVENEGVLSSPIALETPISYLATEDLAGFGIRALEDPRLDGETLNLGGPEPVTHAEVLPILSALLGREIRFQQIPLGAVERQTGADMAAMIRFFNTNGFTVDMSPVLERIPVSLTSVSAYLAKSGWGRSAAAAE